MLKAGLIFFIVSVTVYVLMECFLFKAGAKHAIITGVITGAIATPFWVLFMKYYLKTFRKTIK